MHTGGLIYSELLDLLQPKPSGSGVLFGTLTGFDPLTVEIAGRALRQGLLRPRGMVFQEEDLGTELALLPCAEGFLILFQVEEGCT